MITAQELIEKYELQSHPEGGHYLQTYCSTEIIPPDALPARFNGNRYFSTAIYFLLAGKQFSAFHRIKSDELWHFYHGVGLHIYVLHPDGRGEVLKLGDNLANGYSFQLVVPAGCWFASKPIDENGFSFVGCTVAPGFDFADFEMAKKDELIKQYPQYEGWINQLC
ncbi:cupin domain-containing protein [Terrimonas pollutisoli]|uniref:cupin domain-containing protein n=1 Tax=Terrimonas pollutisoli TaxID=3034147 RepID=UPI0023EA836F|nr:cupin domain-containing protein [Terrimonas sp. H1YJ31]